MLTGLFAFAGIKRYLDIWQQLSISQQDANGSIFGNFQTGDLSFPYSTVIKGLAPAKRAAAVREMGDYIRKYTSSQEFAAQYLSQREAAKQAGMSETYLSAALRKPEIQVFIARKMRETIAIGGLRASARLVELIDAGSEHVSADVSKHTLAIAGIKPTADAQVSVNIDIKAGYVIDLSEGERRPTIDVSPTRLAHD